MKRFFDVVAAGLGLFVLAPVILILALLIRRNLGRTVIFRQERPGRFGKSFTIYKFRTMTDAKDANGEMLSDADRLTPFGRWLRGSSLDELPELCNVLNGDMSLVGPRPLLLEYLPRYSAEQARRHDVRPGITGWAQVNGRNSLSWEARFEMDVWYVEHQTFWLDLKILWRTLIKVFHGTDISAPGEATMWKFLGSSDKQ